MDFKHRNHLISSYLTLRKQVQEIRDTICEGRPPTGTFASLTPLPKEMQELMLSHLKDICELFEHLVQIYAKDELNDAMKREPISATVMWASIQLRQLQETISEIHPKVFERKFGHLNPDEKAYIAEIVEKALTKIQEAQKYL